MIEKLNIGHLLHSDSFGDYTIMDEIGRGASTITYLAENDFAGIHTVRIIKEYCPSDLKLVRNEDGSLWSEEDKRRYHQRKERFLQGGYVENQLRNILSLRNFIPEIRGIFEANNTLYLDVTAFEGKTFAEKDDFSLLTRMKICLSIAKLVKRFHEAGFLCLDIKPSNFMVLDATAKSEDVVQYIDFDSICQKDEIEAKSYTEEWAAPEQTNPYSVSKICEATDIYALGELVFWSVFDRHSNVEEHRSFSTYPFEEAAGYKKYIGRTRIANKLTEIFRNTLRSSTKNRYADAKFLITHLTELVEEMEKKVCLVSSRILQGSFFVGRENELEQIDKGLRDNRIVFINGIGGIGKSTLIREYLKRHEGEYDNILYLQYSNSVEQTLANDLTVTLTSFNQVEEGKSEKRYFERKVQKIRELIQGTRSIMVIDNFTGEIDEDLVTVLEMNWQVVIVSRQKLLYTNAFHLDITSIAEENALQCIFAEHLGREVTADEQKFVDNIIKKVSGHTLVLELIAKQIANTFNSISIEEASSLADELGLSDVTKEKIHYEKDAILKRDTVGNIIDALFETSGLSEEKRVQLKTISLLGVSGIDVVQYKAIMGLGNFDMINELVRDGWLMYQGKVISMHPVIQEAVHRWGWMKNYIEAAERLMCCFYAEIQLEATWNNYPKKYAMVTEEVRTVDYYKLEGLLMLAREIIEQCQREQQIRERDICIKFQYGTVLYMPYYQENEILKYAYELFEQQNVRCLMVIMELYCKVIRIHLDRGEFSDAESILAKVKGFAYKAHSSKGYALYYDVLSDYYDTLLDGYYDVETVEQEHLLKKMQRMIDKTLRYAKRNVSDDRNHIYVANLLAKATVFIRSTGNGGKKVEKLLTEAKEVMEKTTLEYADVRFQYYMVLAWYYALLFEDKVKTQQAIQMACKVSDVIHYTDLDKIDCCIVPCANIYLELGVYNQARYELLKGMELCDKNDSIDVYKRKREELQNYEKDVIEISKQN